MGGEKAAGKIEDRGNVNIGPLIRLAKALAAHTGQTVAEVVQGTLEKPLTKRFEAMVREQSAAIAGGGK